MKKIDKLNRRLKIRQDRLNRLKGYPEGELNETNMINEITQEIKKEKRKERKLKIKKINKKGENE